MSFERSVFRDLLTPRKRISADVARALAWDRMYKLKELDELSSDGVGYYGLRFNLTK